MEHGKISERIDKSFDDEKPGDYRSKRIGASSIGNPCSAFLAFAIRGFPELPTKSRFKRIFRDGHRIEDFVIKDLRKAGYTVEEKDPFTGKQYEWTKYSGYVVFMADGLIEGNGLTEKQLLEVKSMNGAMWDKFKERGVRVSHPKYYDQVQIGMGMSGYRKTVLVAYNKNTSEYWDETIDFDDVRYHFLLQRALNVLIGEPERIATDATDWRCKDCPKRDVCWNGAPVVQDIRTCANAKPADGGWNCDKGCTTSCKDWKRYEPKPRT